MKFRGLLIAALALAGLGGLVWWSNKAEQAKKDQPAADAPPRIIDIAEDTIARLEIRKKGGAAVVLEKPADGPWKLTAPQAWATDQSTVQSLVSAVAKLDSNRLVEEKPADLGAFGLKEPQLEIIVTRRQGEPIRLLIGDETPTGSNYFARLDKDPRLFTLASWTKTSIDKTPWDLRDKRLLTFDSDKLTRIELTAKGQTVEIGKNNQNEWQIVRPQPHRADGGNVEQLISRLKDARMDTEPTPEQAKEAAAEFAKAKLVAVARVTDAAGAQELEVRKSSDTDFYARSSAVEGIHKVSTTVSEGLDKGLDEFRNKKLFDFGWNEPSKIEVKDGQTAHAYEKSGEKWMKAGKQMDAETVRTLIDELRNLAATAFPDKGFTESVLEAKVTWDNGKRSEKVLVSKSGERYFARRENEPSIYEVEALGFDRLQKAVRGVKEHQEKKEGAGGDKK
jgi:hypothetical protein